jgi:hypothetical protein
VKLCQTCVDLFRTAATPTDPYLPYSYSGNQLLNTYSIQKPYLVVSTLTLCK